MERGFTSDDGKLAVHTVQMDILGKLVGGLEKQILGMPIDSSKSAIERGLQLVTIQAKIAETNVELAEARSNGQGIKKAHREYSMLHYVLEESSKGHHGLLRDHILQISFFQKTYAEIFRQRGHNHEAEKIERSSAIWNKIGGLISEIGETR